MSNTDQLSAILGIGPNSTLDEIKQAYRDLVQVWHPDRFANNPRLQQKAQEHLKEINWAYNALLTSLQSSHQGCSTAGVQTESFSQDASQEVAGKAPDSISRSRLFPAATGLFALIIVIITCAVMPSIRSDLAEIPYNLGTIHYQAGHYSEALRMYKAALWIKPDSGKYYCGAGEASYSLARFDEAKDSFMKAVKINSSDAKAYRGLALSYCWLGVFEKSWEICRKARMIDPHCFGLFYEIGFICERKGLLAEAEDAYKKSIELNPAHEQAYYRLGTIYTRKGQYTEAAWAYGKAVQVNPYNTEVRNNLAAALDKADAMRNEMNSCRSASRKSSAQSSYK